MGVLPRKFMWRLYLNVTWHNLDDAVLLSPLLPHASNNNKLTIYHLVKIEHWELDDYEIAALPRAEERDGSPQSSDDEAGSEDNFVAEPDEAIPLEELPSDHSDEGIGSRIHRRGARKRKSNSRQIEASVKRYKITEDAAPSPPLTSAEDPIRKSCLELLVRLLTPIFSEGLPDEPEPPTNAVGAEQFATELETCVFEIYADHTDFDNKIPGNKYKERIRMLNFNLGKKDRKELRQSIRVGRISPNELSRMSSIDLANSQAQQEAHKLAEEAMNHSILQARTAPLRKITHKGEQVIEQSLEEDNWRLQEEEAARDRERELQRSRSNTVGSAHDGEKTRAKLSGMFSGGTTQEGPMVQCTRNDTTEKVFDPASAVFNVDFDGDGPTLHEHGPPTPPGLSGEHIVSSENALGDGLQIASPSATSVSPTAQNFSLDGIFGTSEPATSIWNDIRESEGSISAHSPLGDGPVAPPDDADFDAFITVEDDETPEEASSRDDHASNTAEPTTSAINPSLADLKTIWQGRVGMPSTSDPSRMIQFQSEFKQVAGAPFHDIEANRQSLFPVPLFEIIGRVPTTQATNYLVSMRLNPTKELFACILCPREDDKGAYLELHQTLLGKDRYGLIFPWGQDPPLSAPGKELYIAPLLPEHPIPEYIQLLDNVNIPARREGPVFCGIFVLSKGRVTALDAKEHSYPTPVAPIPSFAPVPPTIPATLPNPIDPANSLLGVQPVLPSVTSSLSNLSESSLATLSKDLASLTPGQLELVRSLLVQQPLPGSTSAPAVPPTGTTLHQNMSSRGPPHQGPGLSGPFLPTGRSPSHISAPLHWDRPRESYPDRGWEPGPGPGRYGRDDYARDNFTREDPRRDDFRLDEFRRDDFGRDDFGREDFGRSDFAQEEFRRDEFRRDGFRREVPRDDWPPHGRNDSRDDRPIYRGRGGRPSHYRGRGRGPPARWRNEI
ncbi:transcription elongation factor S-II [Rhizoctonia solani]|uniref:SPOC domain n=1 Tax=Rhizoctonia solani TaxID=456999 RepID=A0A8H7H341_9AGAM|nr:transcription elongation factor S-II [Rhizoctonia solani]KAF8673471.1 SPOC domain [Rhizoctonia solani]QRW16902.1 transcription elongation factor S-II [Rhizoctonia solani]